MVKPNLLDLSPDIGWQWIVHNLDTGPDQILWVVEIRMQEQHKKLITSS